MAVIKLRIMLGVMMGGLAAMAAMVIVGIAVADQCRDHGSAWCWTPLDDGYKTPGAWEGTWP